MVLVSLLICILHLQVLHALENSALFQNPTGDISVGKFAEDPFHYLWEEKKTSSKVSDHFYCAFLCVGEPKCYSFNVAVDPDSNGLYLCELLATDKYRANERFRPNATFYHYSPWSPCENNPCKNGADCIPGYDSYRCQCSSGFAGKNCEYAPESCSVIKLRDPKAPSGSYVIDPDGEGGVTPFTVVCDMTDKYKVGVTLINHDSENRTMVDGCEPNGCYKRNVRYDGADFLQLGNLTAISAHCEQFIKYECLRSVLFYNGDARGWWVSRDGDKMTYWGGSNSSYPYKCGCWIARTCVTPSYGCNCDVNDGTWREDNGLLTDKSHLPVRQLRFGDTGGGVVSEYGYHTLGKLKSVMELRQMNPTCFHCS